ncbi:hypothetical protein G3A56_27310 (plasmid) [Rhizobium oryzihabitans]|uniref:Uncharacterized protein n=1 Tax=Rhizobium oryzihabitans TaxID=2267833 RepID=A0A7L5BRE9_9HYPH|nr:hypothetical protein [Rhizobium oryzihabitans]QIB41509.1 hypothetical protein G3A56_27310 [Rhizobium oryzihabitans]
MNAKKTDADEQQRAKTGRRPVVKDAIATFVANLTADADDYADLWEKEWETFADKSVSTRNIYASRYRNAIREAYVTITRRCTSLRSSTALTIHSARLNLAALAAQGDPRR